jgi:putative flippase GtrA
MILTNKRERTRFIKFLGVGVIGFVVDFGVFNVLKLMHVPSNVAQTISFLCAVVSNFTINRYWTYPDSRSKPIWHQLTQFTIVSIIGWGIRFLIFHFIENPIIRFYQSLALPLPFSPQFLGSNTTLVMGVFIVLIWNFLVNRYWTYSDVE